MTDESGRARREQPGSAGQSSFSERSTPVFLHDYNLPQTFVARESELLQLTRVVTENAGETRVVAVTAIGGVGKSCLCRELLERPEIAARFTRVIWFSFYESRTEAEDYFLREVLTHGLEWKDQDKPLEGAKEHVRLRRALSKALDRDRVLLVLDGMEVVQSTNDPASATYGAIKPTWSETDKLLRHVLNGPSSVCLITSRVPLRDLETIRGYCHVPLDSFAPKDGAHLLRSLGVAGATETLEKCAESLGGHALSLVAAGRYMARHKIAADRLGDLIGDHDVFRRTAEGEKVKRISDWYRSELTIEQEYFLTRLSLHGRAVNAVNYPVVVLRYRGAASDAEVEENIIRPLVERGLVDRLEDSDRVIRFTAHPLMKLAFSTWLEPEERKRAHEDWARAATNAPGLFIASAKASLEELQPLIDATEQYLAADNWYEAWNIYSSRGLGSRLGRLGYFDLSLKLAQRFDNARSRNQLNPSDTLMLLDRLAWLSSRLEKDQEALRYRRQELTVARHAQSPLLPRVEALVAGALASAGFVQEAAEIKPSDKSTRGKIALARGRYAQAVKLLQAAIKEEAEKDEDEHPRTVIAQSLAESFYRAGKFDEAATVLDKGLRMAIEGGFTCCQRPILSHLIDLSLRRSDLGQARRWADTRRDLLRRLELGSDEHYWLLLVEGDFDGALSVADRAAPTDPKSVIERHTQRARIFLGQRRREEATVELDAAEHEQSTSGFRQFDNDIVALRQELKP